MKTDLKTMDNSSLVMLWHKAANLSRSDIEAEIKHRIQANIQYPPAFFTRVLQQLKYKITAFFYPTSTSFNEHGEYIVVHHIETPPGKDEYPEDTLFVYCSNSNKPAGIVALATKDIFEVSFGDMT